MIGDSPEIDILGAHQVNIPAVLVSAQLIQYPTLRDYRILMDKSIIFSAA